jgi:signal transduction histidine kinase
VVFALATALAIAAGGLLFLHQLRADLNDTIDSGLRAELADLAQELTSSGHLPPLGPGDDPILVERLDGTLIVASPAAAGRSLTAAQRQNALAGDLVFDADVAGVNNRVLLSTVAAAPPTGRVFVAVANDTDISDDAVERVESGLIVAGPLAALLAGVGAWLLADTALRPVQRMRREATNIGEHDPERRLAIPTTHDEVAALGATINGLLDRLNLALERERRFVDDASHELRTPLAILRTELELAIRPGRSAKAIRAAVADASQETERLTRLTDDLLVLARADSHRPILRTKPVQVAELLATTIRSRHARRPAIELHCPEDLRIVADPDRLGQAVGNLLDNSIRHTPAGTLITLTAGRGNDGRIVLDVIDAGPGLAPTFLAAAFERFHRAEQARSRDTGGTGLGLPIVRAIAEAHGGSVHLVNNPDGGARATIRLPLIPPMTSDRDDGRSTSVPLQRNPTTAEPAPGGSSRRRPAANPWPTRPPRNSEPVEENP